MTEKGIPELLERVLIEILEADGSDVKIDRDSVLVGRGAVISSLQLVAFISEVEQRLDEELGLQVTVADERAMSMRSSPFRSISTLAGYVAGIAQGDA